MSLSTNVQNLALRIATELKSIRTLLNGNAPDLSALETTNKANLVAALNEVKTLAEAGAGGGAVIDDTVPRTTTVYSSSKTEAVVAAAVSGIDPGAVIDDANVALDSTYSSNKILSAINAAITALVEDAPEALDTLNELAAALGDDPNFAASTATALANRVRFDTAQTLTGGQQIQARANIGAASAADVGDTTTNFVTIFEAALA